MSYHKVILLLFILLGGCVTPPETIVPALTFDQYASKPILFESVEVSMPQFSPSRNDTESKLREGVTSYLQSRFRGDSGYTKHLIIEPVKLEVSKVYLQVGGKNDLLSAWKSYDQYIFESKIKLSMACDTKAKETIKTINIAKTSKVPASYSPYKRDTYLLSVVDGYIWELDTAIRDALMQQKAEC